MPHARFHELLAERESAPDRRPVIDALFRDVFLEAVYYREQDLIELLLDKGGVPINTPHEATGMTALHLAVGRDDLRLARMLVDRGAKFLPDKRGRWPSEIAAVCEVSEELSEYIEKAQAQAEASAS